MLEAVFVQNIWAGTLGIDEIYNQPDLEAIGCPYDGAWILAWNGIGKEDIAADWLAGGRLGDAGYLDDGEPIPETFYRLREGIERFFITDINNPAASASAQSELIVMFDAWGNSNNESLDQTGTNDMAASRFNHVPGGSNVLYMDGHVEFVKYGNQPLPRIDAQKLINELDLNSEFGRFVHFLGGIG
jgi:prepilin-type processing-associated H-X9-DG protein